jgi:lysophospholipase L1-like esterase
MSKEHKRTTSKVSRRRSERGPSRTDQRVGVAAIRQVAIGLASALVLTGCGVHSSSQAGSTTASTPNAPAVNPPDTPTPAAKGGAAVPVVAKESPTPKSTPKAKKPMVVGFGDSVPSGGGGCNCVNFVSAYANLVGKTTGVKPAVDNFAVSGSTSADFLDQLSDSKIRAAVEDATTILIMTGANDYNDAFDQASIGGSVSKLYAPVADAVEDNVTTAINKIQDLNSGAHVVLLDYWASMEDGAVAKKDYDATAMAASIACTTSTNNALALAAKATGATYVSTYTAFKGADGTKDDTALLQPDGDHPDPAGHQVIAQAITAVYPRG